MNKEVDDMLTNEQCELVTKNHNLIYSYAYKKNVSIQDNYDVLAIGLCKAAKTFNKSKGEFSTLAYCCMENELLEQYRLTQKQSYVPDNLVLSYNKDDAYDKDNLSEYLIDRQASESISYVIMSSEFEGSLNEKEIVIYKFLLSGLTYDEIADNLGCKKQSVHYHIKKIRNKFSDYFYCK